MANPFVKGWKYLMALFGAKIDEHADPKVQIQQAIEDAQRQHQALSQQAAAVIGNQRQLEMKLSRQMAEVERLQASPGRRWCSPTRPGPRATRPKAAEYEQTAQTFATQLVAAEQSMEDLKTLHDQALRRRRAGQQGGREQRDDRCSRSSPSAPSCSASWSRPRCRRRWPASLESMSRAGRAGQHPVAGRGAGQDRAAVRERARLGRARAELGRGPDARGAEVDPGHGRLRPAGADPGQHGRRPARLRAADPGGGGRQAGEPVADPAAQARLDQLRSDQG